MSELQIRKTAACRSGKDNPRGWKEDAKSCIKSHISIFTDEHISSAGAMPLRAQVTRARCRLSERRFAGAKCGWSANGAHRKPDTPLVFFAALRAPPRTKSCSPRCPVLAEAAAVRFSSRLKRRL